MAINFWDCKGVLLVDYLPPNTTVNAARYCEVLTKLRAAIKRKRPGLLSRKVSLVHDNARQHAARTTQTLLVNFKWEIFTHPSYSSDLAPSDFHLFPALKLHLGGKQFANDDEVQAEANHWLRKQDTAWYNSGIKNCYNDTKNIRTEMGYDLVAQANGWNIRYKARFLAAALLGAAVEVLQMIPEQFRLDFNALINALESRYGKEHCQRLHLVKFKNRLQERSLQDLDIRRLTRLAFPTRPSEIQDFMAQHQFIDAIGDSETKRFARLSSATTLKENLVQAMKRPCVPQNGHCAHAEDRFCIRQVTVQESDEIEKQHWTGQALKKYQREDQSWEYVAPYSPKTKGLWSFWNSLSLRDGVYTGNGRARMENMDHGS
ncbi:hypothetical protein LAZ67_14001999 [Cordylochernes scorpioides]|uniref:Transposase n=1 Tax=Cordylochernes scorpioides TaxID=51811 RepID=A0ABY6L6Y4_9ARAC|nr:hypothetical protein LAZ67_14001999 [Cordylochernes scorpioides]